MFNFFKRLFGQQTDNSDAPVTGTTGNDAVAIASDHADNHAEDAVDAATTKPLSQAAVENTEAENIGAPRLVVSQAQSTGMVRDHNEDVMLTLHNSFGGDEGMPTFGLFVVADGMGGHQAGEHASAVAARTVAELITREVYLPLLQNPDDPSALPPIAEVMSRALNTANERVSQEVADSGTTTTAALVLDHRLFLGHVGDSRAYLYNPNEDMPLKLITRDHTLVQRLQELGQLTAEEAAIHPQKHVLYRAVGQGEGLEVDVEHVRITPGTRLVICSDGLSGVIEEAEIEATIANAADSQAACEQLVAAANNAGGPDNITVLIIDFVH